MNRKIRTTFVLLLLILAMTTSVAIVKSQQSEPIPLVVVYYGSADSTAALGMQVAVAEMQDFGPFVGADGLSYQLIGFVTEDPSLLADATAVLVSPVSPAFPPGTVLNAPVFVLSSDAALEIPDLQAAVFRAMTPERRFYDALANFSVAVNTDLQNVFLIGDGNVYGAGFAAFEASLRENDPARNFSIQTLASASPSPDEITSIATINPQMIVYRGTIVNAAGVLDGLRSAGWSGAFIYDRAYEAAQQGLMRSTAAIQIAGMTPWANSLGDDLSQQFRISYITRTGKLPDALAVSAYDITWAVRLMVQRVGSDAATIATSIPTTDTISITQGEINPAGGADLVSAVVIYQLEQLGGMRALARYDGGALVTDSNTGAAAASVPTAIPLPTSTPDQPIVTVTIPTLNVRSGPGLNYDIIGKLSEGNVVIVVGTIPDFSWFYVQATNGLGWVKAEFVQLFAPDAGGVATIPQVPIPPTPTPGATDTPQIPADIVIDNVVLNPARPIINQPFTAQVTVRNAGSSASDGFAVTATWQPGGVLSSVGVAPLQPFDSVVVTLQAQVNASGQATVDVIADPANVVVEVNENNNTFQVSYIADANPIANTQGTFAVGQYNFAGSSNDLDWMGADIGVMNGAHVGIINGISYDDVHVGLLTSGAITAANLGTVNPGTVFGMRTGEGHCGVFRIDNVVGGNITMTYRMYAVGDC